MQENNDQRQLAHAVIAEVTTYVSSLLSQSLSAGVDSQKPSNLEIHAKFVIYGQWDRDNPSIQLEVKTESAEGAIGIYISSKTMDISIRSMDTIESLYEFHGNYDTVAEIKQCLEEVVEVLTNT